MWKLLHFSAESGRIYVYICMHTYIDRQTTNHMCACTHLTNGYTVYVRAVISQTHHWSFNGNTEYRKFM